MQHTDSLDNVSDNEIISGLDSLRAQEIQGEHDFIRHLAQMDKRGLYRELGYSCLFYYCTKRLGFSRAEAQRRIDAARCLGKHPEVYELVKNKELTLSAVSIISKVVIKQNKPELITQALGKPIHEVEKLVAEHLPLEKQKRDTVRVKRVILDEEKVETRVSMTIELDSELMELYERAKSYMGGSAKPREVMRKVLREYVKRVEDERTKSIRKAPVRTKLPSAKSTYISRSVRAEVSRRDGYRCTYVSPDGVRCEEMHRLEFDHIVPRAKGGTEEVSNLRLCCKAHNQFYAEQSFGREFVRSHFRSELVPLRNQLSLPGSTPIGNCWRG